MTAVERPRRLVTTVTDQLRDLILDGVLRPGEELRQERLARQLDVSRTPLKHALQELANEGLVTFSSGSTAYVISLTAKEASELMEVRELVDGMVARKLAGRSCSAEFESEARRLVDELEKSARPGNRPRSRYLHLNQDFHTALLMETGHYEIPRLLPVIRRSSQLPYLQDWAGHEMRIEVSAAEHRPILEAILAGDEDRAETLAREHVRRAARHWAAC